MIKRDVYTAYRFAVEIDSITEAAFSECSGLQVETEIFEWEEGGQNGFRHRLPGRLKYTNLVFKRGIASSALWTWHEQTMAGEFERRTLAIILYNFEEKPQTRWNVVGALPVKWTGPTFKSGSTDVALETFEIMHHGFTRQKL